MSKRAKRVFLFFTMLALPHGVKAALNFTAANNAVTISSPSIMAYVGVVSMSCWFNPTGTIGFQTLVTKTSANNVRQFSMYLGNGGVTDLFIGFGNGSGTHITLSIPWASNFWNFIAVTNDGTNVNVYMNGKLSATGASSTFGGQNTATSSNVYIGDDVQSANFPMNGLIDDARIYNRVLSASEVLTFWNSRSRPLDTDGSIGHYRMDDNIQGATSASVKDFSQYRNNGLMGSGVSQSSGPLNYP